MIGNQFWYCFYHHRVLQGHMGQRPNDCGAPDYLECIVKVALPVAEDSVEQYGVCAECGHFLTGFEQCAMFEEHEGFKFITVIEDA